MTLGFPARSWPALATTGDSPLPSDLDYERGVWGKVHGAHTDYQWIAASAAFASGDPPLEGELRLGSEDVPRHAVHWRVVGDRACAVVCYPSRSTDAAGRTSFLEKQVFVWQRPAEIPSALGALFLLPRIAAVDNAIWWERRQIRLSDEDSLLTLTPADHPPLALSVEDLESTIDTGIEELGRVVSEEVLGDLYARLLAGQSGVPIAGRLAEPLSGAALAAVLLPLPRSLADRLSLTGWLPAQRIPDVEDLARCWSAVLGGSVLPPSPAVVPSPLQQQRGRELARALLHRAPATAAGGAVINRSSSRPRKSIPIAVWGAPSAGKTALLTQLYLEARGGGWEVLPSEKSQKFIDDMRNRMRSQQRFPPATSTPEPIEYRCRLLGTQREFSLRLEDRAGSESVKPSEGMRRQLQEASGLVLLFDPLVELTELEDQISRTLEQVYLDRDSDGPDSRPVALCFSKADFLIATADDLRLAREDPDGFIRRQERIQKLEGVVRRFCSNYRLFPVSAAGVRLRYGVVEPIVFYDEALSLRLRSGGESLNVFAPFAWVLDEVAGQQ